MKSFLDFEEKNVEKAVQKACDELNVSREKLKYDIISHGSSGIFGLVGTRKALIRVFVPELSNKQLQSEIFDDAAKLNSSNPPNQNDASALVDEAFGQAKELDPEQKPIPLPKRNKPLPVKQKFGSSQIAPGKAKPFSKKPKMEKLSVETQLQIKPEQSEQQPASIAIEPMPPIKPVSTPEDNKAAAAVALPLAQKILGALAIDAELSVDNASDFCRINVKAQEPGVLIGKKGQTLDAIQYLLDKVVNKQCGKGSHVVFDVEGYVESRKTELTDLASRLASKTMKTGKPSTMTRMNAHDRRIVHVSLKNNPWIRTQSVGDGYYRKLIIFPKKKASKKTHQDTQKE